MSRGRGNTSMVRLIGLLAALSLALCLASAGNTPIADAAGVGPCSPVTANDLAQPQVTRRGQASAQLSRTQGTSGTQLTLTGSGWPAGADVGLDFWVDYSGQFIGGPHTTSSVTTTASGVLPPLAFRLPSGFGDLCPNGMNLNGAQLDHVTILLVAHTLDSDFQHVRARIPFLFTLLAPPTLTSSNADNPVIANAYANASMPLVGAGWEPGESVTITSLVTPWQGNAPEPSTVTPTPTPAGSITVTAHQQGGFTLPYRLPAIAPLSTVALLIHSHDARYGDVTFIAEPTYFILPPVYPRISIHQSSTTVGGAVTITGDQWLPGERVVVEYCRGQTFDSVRNLYCDKYSAESLGDFQADSAGHFVVQVRLPTNARPGEITMQARLASEELWRPYDIRPFAAALPLTIVAPITTPTFTQTHPRLARLLMAAPYFVGWLLLLAAILAAMYIAIRRQRRGTPPTS